MNLRGLRTLVEIDRVGAFATAAEQLGLTLSAVSAQMKTLERELGVALFDRAHRPPAMTPAARAAAVHAQRIIAEVDAIRAIGAERSGLTGVFRVGFVPTASVRLMPDFLARAAEHHPKARFQVESGLSTEMLAKLASARLDAAVITETPETPPEITVRTLFTETFALAAPERAAGWELARCAEELPFVRFTPSSGIGLLVERHLRSVLCSVRETIMLDSVEAVMGCVNAGVGFAVLPEPDARRYAARAVVSPLTDPPLARRIGLAVHGPGPAAQHAEALAGLFSLA